MLNFHLYDIRNKIKDLFCRLELKLRKNSVYYIGGSDILPPPLEPAGSFMIWQSVKECRKKGQKARKKRENLHRKSRKSACQAVPFLVS